MSEPSPVVRSLEAVAERIGDPGPRIYARLFAAHPELEALFVMDPGGEVRGSMLQQCFDCVLDLAGARRVAPTIIHAGRMDHEGYGVPDGLYDRFFEIVRDECRDILGADWTSEIDAAWARLIEAVRAIA